MIRFKPKFKKDEIVIIRRTGDIGKIMRVLPHPFAPEWLSSSNYLVMTDMDETRRIPSNVFTKKQLKRIR
jgi:hypothetical protein